LWNSDEGFFYDYNYLRNKISNFLSLASFMPLWAGMATPQQAKRMVKKLKLFETQYGLTCTAKASLAPKVDLSKIPISYRITVEDVLRPKQWDYPNIWPPVEYLTVIGLLKYGYIDDATRIMKKSLEAQAGVFEKHKTFFEKIDGVTGDKAEGFHYPNQSGFGWTNAIFYRYVAILDAIEGGENIYQEPKPKDPPFKISIPH
jgi:alpha,alpha-trehalase